MKNKKTIGLLCGLLAAIIINICPLKGLTREGRLCLALSIMTVIFWAFQIAQSGYISGLLLDLFVIFHVADPTVVFASWTGTTIYLIIGAYLIASAVKSSGLGERIAYWYVVKFVDSYQSIIISVFVMTLILSLIVPHPWPRAFLIMSIMKEIIDNANISKKDSIAIGYSVFAASVPLSCVFLTGDSSINPLAVQYSGLNIGWFEWFLLMGVPCLIAAVLTCIAFLFIFRPKRPVRVSKQMAQEKLRNMGKLNAKEIRTIIWLVISVILWATDSIHRIDIGWITLVIAMLMAMPLIGELLTASSFNDVPIHVLLFITAAMAIGKVGAATGMNDWIAQTIFPEQIPSNILVFALFVGGISVVIHMLLGSVIAVMGVAIPAILAYTQNTALSPIVPTLWVFTSITLHYIFPFQNMNILVGQGEENGLYSQKETIRFSLPLLFIVILTLLMECVWWKLLGYVS